MKKNILQIILCIVLFSNSYGQVKNKSIAFVSTNTTVQAEVKIYLLGGIVSAITQKEVDFSKKYSVLFLDFGCVPPTNLSYYEEQNFKAFDLLNIQFGPKWQEELKSSTLGFKKWKEKNK